VSKSRIAVLASGGGSNLQAILDHFARLGDRRGGDVVLVASDRANAGALDRASKAGISNAVIATKANPGGEELLTLLERHGVNLVALAGYLRLIPNAVIDRYAGRIVNVHPALLPAFGGAGMYGMRVHQAVLDAGVTLSGVTVHFVDAEYDRGAIIAQWPVPVCVDDDDEALAARVLRVEHVVYPRVLDAVAAGRITLSTCPVVQASTDVSFSLRPRDEYDDEDCLAREIDHALGQ
jgi:phosphoribosylglycinamide formyltransferase-1